MSGPVFILWFISMPETLEDNILLRRAKRLRKLTGDNKYVSQSELNQKNMTAGQIAKNAFVKPVEINIKDPAILFTSIYSGIIYGTYYSFFEVFPLVYGGIYGFNIGEIGLVFICIAVGAAIGMILYDLLILKVVIPDILKNGMGPQEGVLKPALIFVFGPTLSLFLFAWTSRESIHWMAPTVFLTIYPVSSPLLSSLEQEVLILPHPDLSLHSLPSNIRLYPSFLPSIRRLPLRRQRFRALFLRFRLRHVLAQYVY